MSSAFRRVSNQVLLDSLGGPRIKGPGMDGASLYILRCREGKLTTGLTRREVEERVSEHAQGLSDFTRSRLPVELIFSEHYEIILDAIAAERRIKGWTRAKKLAYVAGDFERLSVLARRRSSRDLRRD